MTWTWAEYDSQPQCIWVHVLPQNTIHVTRSKVVIVLRAMNHWLHSTWKTQSSTIQKKLNFKPFFSFYSASGHVPNKRLRPFPIASQIFFANNHNILEIRVDIKTFHGVIVGHVHQDCFNMYWKNPLPRFFVSERFDKPSRSIEIFRFVPGKKVLFHRYVFSFPGKKISPKGLKLLELKKVWHAQPSRFFVSFAKMNRSHLNGFALWGFVTWTYNMASGLTTGQLNLYPRYNLDGTYKYLTNTKGVTTRLSYTYGGHKKR